MSDLRGLRVMAVHAHPDDEALWTGGLLAHLSRRGADVRVVTCTLGEQGEVIGEPMQGLIADEADMLGGFRYRELEDSLRILGVNGVHHRPCVLGGVGRWRDSGMVGTPSADHPRAFVKSGQQAVDALKALMSDFCPDIVVTYGPDGGYGHPDHIRAHEITHAAVAELPHTSAPELGGEASGEVPGDDEDLFSAVLARRHGGRETYADHGIPDPVVFWAVRGETALKQAGRAISRIPDGWVAPGGMDFSFADDAAGAVDSASPEKTPGKITEPDLAFVPDDLVDVAVQLSDADIEVQANAMAAHATQLWIADGRQSWINPESAWAVSDPIVAPKVFALSNCIAQPLMREEHYVVAYGGSGPWAKTTPARYAYDSSAVRARGRSAFSLDQTDEGAEHDTSEQSGRRR